MDKIEATYSPETQIIPKTERTSIHHCDGIPVVPSDGICGIILAITTPEVGQGMFFKHELTALDPASDIGSESTDLIASQNVKNEDEDLPCEGYISRRQFRTNSRSSLINVFAGIKSEEYRENHDWDQPQHGYLKIKTEAPLESSDFGNASESGSKKPNSGHHIFKPSTDFSPLVAEKDSVFDSFTQIKTDVKEEDYDSIDPLHISIDIKDGTPVELSECENDTECEDRKSNLESDIHNPLNYFPTDPTKLEETVNDITFSHRPSNTKTQPDLHNYVKHTNSSYECLSDEFPSPKNINESGNTQLICSHCSVSFADEGNLNEHLGQNSGEKRFICIHCSLCFAREDNLMRHTLKHTGEKPFSCSHCSSFFFQKYQLNQHMRRHTGEKPFECSNCSASFATKKYLKQHIETHTNEKPFSCSHCSSSFRQKCHLNGHMLIHTGEKPFRCSHCSVWFARKSALTTHIRTHTGEKSFRCSHCFASFALRSNLIRHLKTHTGERPFSCGHCFSSFCDRSKLNKHMATHTGEKPFRCSHCFVPFARRSHLMRHMQKHTTVETIP